MDLTVKTPRDGKLKLGGWVWLPRMIDKARATYRGNPGTFTHPCPRDKKLLAEMGLDVNEFKTIIETCSEDSEVLAEVEGRRAKKGLC